MARIERVSYRTGFVERLGEAERLPAITIERRDLPDNVLALLDAHVLDLGDSCGDPKAGDPIQYDHLRIEHGPGAVEITVYNRAILLFTTDSEVIGRIHQVCCRLDNIAARHCRAALVEKCVTGACGYSGREG